MVCRKPLHKQQRLGKSAASRHPAPSWGRIRFSKVGLEPVDAFVRTRPAPRLLAKRSDVPGPSTAAGLRCIMNLRSIGCEPDDAHQHRAVCIEGPTVCRDLAGQGVTPL